MDLRKVDRDEQAFINAKGYAVILPRYEPIGKFVRLHNWMLFACARMDSFGLGIQLLEAGLLLEIGPFYVGACNIQKQVRAYEQKDADCD